MSDKRINLLINNLSERLDVEVKNWLNGLKSNEDKSTLAKEIIALANSGGGFIFIGFDDQGDKFPEIQPQIGEPAAFTQDGIASVVEKYVSPPCQCSVSYHQQTNSDIDHPVISVPGYHRTPVFANHGSPDNKKLQLGTVYVRRPGGASERAKTQDDWEKLLDRLVKARQEELLDAMRGVLNPQQSVIQPEANLYQWDKRCLNFWNEKIKTLPESDARRNEKGYWTVSFQIESFNRPRLTDLSNKLVRGMPIYSGFPPFQFIEFGCRRPIVSGNELEAWLADSNSVDEIVEVDNHADYWRLSNRGKGFLLRPMQEDRADFPFNIISPKPVGPFFSWTLPIYHITEVLKFIESLAGYFADNSAQFSLLLNYFGTNGRKLVEHTNNYSLPEGAVCSQSQLKASLSSVAVSEIGLNLEEMVYTLLSPVYEQFDITELPKALVNRVVQETLSKRY